jgi:hypothetical protein
VRIRLRLASCLLACSFICASCVHPPPPPAIVEARVKITAGHFYITRFSGHRLSKVIVQTFGRDEQQNDLVLEVSFPEWPSEFYLGRVPIKDNTEVTMLLLHQDRPIH